MARKKQQVSAAIRVLREAGVEFSDHHYRYQDGGGTAHSASELGVDEHVVIKTLIMQDENAQPLIVLMHGDREVSTKALARTLGVKSIQPCEPSRANAHSGYQVGGTSPFGTRRAMPVYCQRTIPELKRIFINGGARGYLLSLDPQALLRVLQPTLVDVER
jgi:Cys-tRNA(Pro) deacylase